MNDIPAWPVEIRLVVLFLFGIGIAFVLRRLLGASKNVFLGRAVFWGIPLAIVLLFWWEVVEWSGSLGGKITGLQIAAESAETLHLRFAAHVLLFVLLLAASITDFREMIIPDGITVPGTILGLLLAGWLPQTLLPATAQITAPGAGGGFETLYASNAVPLHIASSQAWPEMLRPSPNVFSLVLALAICWGWCFAMLNRVWYGRLPFKKAAAIFWRYLIRSRSTILFAALGLLGSGIIILFWSRAAADSVHWQGFLTALVGLATGAGLIWAVRLIGRIALGREAMGFGDVTLMGMIGTFVGWQSCILIFFLAPLAGIVLGIGRLVLGLGREMPYGPFLCLATVFLVLYWPDCWNLTEPFFSLGWVVPGIMGICLVLLGTMLAGWQKVKNRLGR